MIFTVDYCLLPWCIAHLEVDLVYTISHYFCIFSFSVVKYLIKNLNFRSVAQIDYFTPRLAAPTTKKKLAVRRNLFVRERAKATICFS